MAHIQRRRRGGRARWIGRTLTPDGRERTKTFDRTVDAERWITSVEASTLAGAHVEPARLGHALASETLDTSSHLWPDSEEQARDAVDRVLRGARGMA